MPKHVLTDEELARGRQLGGAALRVKEPPALCARCGRSMEGRTWHAWLGHLGLHGLADAFFAGDVEACQQRLRENGRARQDPAPWNGAWQPYRRLGKEGDDGGRETVSVG